MYYKSITLTFFYSLCILLSASGQSSNWFGKSTVKSIVLLQKFENGKYINHGVGILTSSNDYSIPIIVTCEHVLRNKVIYVAVNADSSFIKEMQASKLKELTINGIKWELENSLLRTKIDLIKNKTYVTHPDSLDIAAFPLNFSNAFLIDDSIKIDFSNSVVVSEKNFGNNTMVNLGEDVYFVGFPFGIGVGIKLEPLLREGLVSWVSSSMDEFLLDAFSYGGNSGSPVYTKMSSLDKKRSKPYLVGMVVGHLGKDYENFGLARCVYIDDIKSVINMAKKL